MGITLLQAVLIGLMFLIFRFMSMGLTFSAPFFFSPMPMSLLIGIILGDVPKAMMIGAALQLMYLGIIAPGGAMPSDPAIAAVIATSIGIASGMDTAQAVVLAVPAGLLGAQLTNLSYMFNVAWLHVADRYANKGSTRGVFVAGAILPQLSRILLTIPLVVVIYLGSAAAQNIIDSIPQWLSNAFATIGSMMPALGFAIILTIIGKKNLLPYFAVGFLAVQYLSIPILPLACFGAVIAYLHTVFTSKGEKLGESIDRNIEQPQGQRLLSRRDITKSFFLWWTFGEVSHNYERLQANTFAIAMSPIIKKLYKTREEISGALKRHLEFFNTEILFGSIVPGITIAMEEQKALGMDINDEAISGIKTGLMGPFAGIGDTLSYGTLLPIILSLFIPLATAGNWIAGAAPPIIYSAILIPIGLWLYNFGYKKGSQSAVQLLQSGLINKVILFASILGLFMMGGLAATYVTVNTPLVITTSGGDFAIQGILDSILKGLLPLLTVAGVYLFLNKVSRNYLLAVGILFGVGLILGAVGVLGGII